MRTILTCFLAVGLALGCAAKKRNESIPQEEPPQIESEERVFTFNTTPYCFEYEPCLWIGGKMYVLEVRMEPMPEGITGVWLLPRSEEYGYLLLYEVEECPCKEKGETQ